MKILFIDDDDLRTSALREGLMLEGYDVKYVQTPHEAVKEVKKYANQYKLIIIDIMLPHYNKPIYKEFSIPKYFPDNHTGIYTGIMLFKEIEEILNERQLKIPVVILTAFDNVDKYFDDLQLYPTKYLYKPIDLDNFINEVNIVTNKWNGVLLWKKNF